MQLQFSFDQNRPFIGFMHTRLPGHKIQVSECILWVDFVKYWTVYRCVYFVDSPTTICL